MTTWWGDWWPLRPGDVVRFYYSRGEGGALVIASELENDYVYYSKKAAFLYTLTLCTTDGVYAVGSREPADVVELWRDGVNILKE